MCKDQRNLTKDEIIVNELRKFCFKKTQRTTVCNLKGLFGAPKMPVFLRFLHLKKTSKTCPVLDFRGRRSELSS